jgi:hypothetical protein
MAFLFYRYSNIYTAVSRKMSIAVNDIAFQINALQLTIIQVIVAEPDLLSVPIVKIFTTLQQVPQQVKFLYRCCCTDFGN